MPFIRLEVIGGHKKLDCIKRDVCIVRDSNYSLCSDCGHYLADAHSTAPNSAITPCGECVFVRTKSPRCSECYRNKVDKWLSRTSQ